MKKFILLSILICAISIPCFGFSLTKTDNVPTQKAEYADIAEQAYVFYAQNDIKESQNLLLSIPEEERTPQNWLILGNILQDYGKSNEAEFMYKKAINADEKYYKAYYNLGNIYMLNDKPNMAVEQYLKVTKIRPDYAYGHYNLAVAYIKLGKYSKARFELLDAIDLNNTIPEFYYNLSYVYKQMKNQKAAQTYLDLYNKLTKNN